MNLSPGDLNENISSCVLRHRSANYNHVVKKLHKNFVDLKLYNIHGNNLPKKVWLRNVHIVLNGMSQILMLGQTICIGSETKTKFKLMTAITLLKNSCSFQAHPLHSSKYLCDQKLLLLTFFFQIRSEFFAKLLY